MSERRCRGAGAVAVVLVLGAAGVWAGSTLATGPAKPKPKVKPTVGARRCARLLVRPRVYVTATDGGVYRLDPA
jgi:hypothetical protein